MPAFAIQLNIFWNSIIFKEKKVSFFTIIKCYSNRCVQNADCRLHTGGVGLSFLDRLIFLHSWWESNETFLGVASVISRPATCLVSITGKHFFECVNGSRAKLKTLFSTRAWHSIRCSTQAPLHALFIPVLIGLCSYKNVLAIWWHSRWNLTLTQIVSLRAFSFDRHFELSRGLPLYISSQTPVPRSPFPVLVTSDSKPPQLNNYCLWRSCHRPLTSSMFKLPNAIIPGSPCKF